MSQHKWTTAEKKKLIRLLKKYDIDDHSRIASHLPNKSAEDVAELFRKEIKIKERLEEKVEVKEEPIEYPKTDDLPAIDKWIGITSGLVGKEYLDFSTHLARVMGVIADLESFPDPNPAAHRPDYRAIYKYLGALLAGRGSEELLLSMRPLESAVILEVLHSLQEVLGAADTNVQRHIMKWKYQLITAQKSNPEEKLKSNRKVIENDFTDFIKQLEAGEDSSDSEDDAISSSHSTVVHPTALFVNKATRKKMIQDAGIESTEAETISQSSLGSVADKTLPDKLSLNTAVNKTLPGKSSLNTVTNKTLPGRKKTILKQTVPDKRSAEAPASSSIGGTSERVNIPGQTKEIPENDPPNATVIKRRNIVYKPPPKGPEIVLVMPPVNKPIIHREVKPRSFRCTKDGKYMSLGRHPKEGHGQLDNSIKQSIKERKIKTSVRPSQETFVRASDTPVKQTTNHAESFVQTINDESSRDIPSHKEILIRMNAKLKQVKVPVQIKQVKKSSVEMKKTETKAIETKVSETTGHATETSRDLQLRLVENEKTGTDGTGNIHLRLPIIDVDGHMELQLPEADIEESGNIHIHLAPDSLDSLDSLDSGPAQLEVPNTEAGSSESNEKGPVITSVHSIGQGTSAEFFAEPYIAPLQADSQSFGTGITNMPALNPVITSDGSDTSVPSIRPESSAAVAAGPSTSFTPAGLMGLSSAESESCGRSTASDFVAESNSSVKLSGGHQSLVAVCDGSNTSVTPFPGHTVLEPASSDPYNISMSSTVFPAFSGPDASVTPSPGHVAVSAISSGPSTSPELTGSARLLERQGGCVVSLSVPEQHSATEFVLEPVKKARKVNCKKRKAFEKSRYAPFEKSEETTKDPEKIPKKPKLYSLNPFCVPISLLDISK